ncbi:hypothetical protein V9T40_012012 [Parthenolecanium corni]|uniref:Uncharacterized protein n=1 Tax=Parthenolecanium corni TaxID=536013 RepID=A0AAN9T840_9HEMI
MEVSQNTTPRVLCVLHLGDAACNETIQPLSEEKFEKLKVIVAARKQYKQTKYAAIIHNFPDVLNETIHGYHYSCYKKFSSIPNSLRETARNTQQSLALESSTTKSSQQQPQANSVSETHRILRSTHSIVPTAEGKQVLEQSCIFCKKKNIKFKYEKQKLVRCSTQNFEKSIREECKILQDYDILGSVGCSDFTALEVFYHKICRTRFSKQASAKASQISQRLTDKEQSIWHLRRKAHNEAFSALCNYINEYILEKEEIASLKNMYDTYSDIVSSHISDELQEIGTAIQRLEEKLNNEYGQKLCFEKIKKDTIVFKNGMNISDAVRTQFVTKSESGNPEIVVRKAAHLLRKSILGMGSKNFDEALSVQKILSDTEDLPDLMKHFLEALFNGPIFRSSTLKFSNRMKSVGADLVFTVSHGKFIPAKHLALGLGLKSITGKKEVLQILNRLGHSINYWLAEELETRMAEEVSVSESVVPDGIDRVPHLSTCVAFDNYDEQVETLSGKGSLHETVGICFQRLNENPAPKKKTPTKTSNLKRSKKPAKKSKKRKLDFTETTLQPYSKPLQFEKAQWSDTVLEKPITFHEAERRDLFWVFSVSVFKDEIPMWIGYNSKTVADNQPKHRVTYLRNYDEHSTNPSMIIETLKITGKIAMECGQKFGIVTYDLAIAKPAMQIQSMESPTFDNIFIHFGAFHLFLAYFAALGKLIAEAGCTHILSESGVLAENSAKGFISGKHFNRCKRLHPLFALALKLQHVKMYFTSTQKELPPGLEVYLMNIFNHREYFVENEYPAELNNFFLEYEEFCTATRNGEHGSTAQFWFSYIDYVFLYLKMSRAVRMNDVDLFTFCLPEMTNLFFVTNHSNYAKWMVRYQENLKNIDSKYPGLKQLLQNGGLSIKRSNIPFAGAPIDQTLEQTINKDSASRTTGISAMTNEPSAHLRWTITRSMRSEIVTKLKDMTGLNSKDDVCRELKPYRIRQDNSDLSAICKILEESANPFCEALRDEVLYNIGTGKAAGEQTKEFLLTTRSKGDQLRTKFIEECKEDSDRFNREIKRLPVRNFETEGIKVKISTKDKKITELGLTCGIFGRLCCLAIQKKLNLEHVLQYSLTPLPLSLVHIDGSMMKTNKSQLLHHLKKYSHTDDSPKEVYDVVDAMFLLHTLPSKLPDTYGELSQYILKKLCSTKANRIDVIFDQYMTPSIKDYERTLRGEAAATPKKFVIQGPHQKRPREFQKALSNQLFKKSFTEFLARDWKQEHHREILKHKILFFTERNKCFCITKESVREIVELECQHEEADTRLFFHCEHIFNHNVSFEDSTDASTRDIVIRTGDTDVLIIFLCNIQKSSNIKKHHKIWLDFGAGKSRHFINVSQMADKLGPKLCESLPAFHAFTGCDYTAAFAHKGKIRPFNILSKTPAYQEAFSSMGKAPELLEKTFELLEQFTCELYGQKRTQTVNKARVQLFHKHNSPKNTSNPFSGIRKTHPALYPPCQSVLRNKILRTQYICMAWNNAGNPNPQNMLKPEDFGWEISDEKYVPKWNNQPYLPPNMEEFQDTLTETLDTSDEEEDITLEDSDFDSSEE